MPIGHPGVKIGVVRLEDPPAQDHLHRLVRDTESGGGRNDEGDHLVGQEVGRLARRWVTLGRGREQDGGELEESPVPEVPGVDGAQHGLRIGQVEVPGHTGAQQCRSASSVRGAQGQPQGTDAQPCATRCEVTGEFGQGGEADRRSVRPNTGTVHPGAAHDPDAPGRRTSRPARRRRCRCGGDPSRSSRGGRWPEPVAPRPRQGRSRPGSTRRGRRGGRVGRRSRRQRRLPRWPHPRRRLPHRDQPSDDCSVRCWTVPGRRPVARRGRRRSLKRRHRGPGTPGVAPPLRVPDLAQRPRPQSDSTLSRRGDKSCGGGRGQYLHTGTGRQSV